MRYILILLLLVGTAYGQSQPTSAKTRFVNGLYMGTKLDSYFAAADSNALYWRADSVVMAKYKGTARELAFASALSGYVDLTTNQTIGGIKTFTKPLIVQNQRIKSDFATNLFIGDQAGENNNPLSSTQGRQNTFIGPLAAANNTTGYAMTAIGYGAAFNNITGDRSTFLGYQSGYRNTIGKYLTAVGVDAGYRNSGDDNMYMGVHVGFNASNPDSISGAANIIIGNETANFASSINNNTIIGHNVAHDLTTGDDLTYLGYQSSFKNTIGSRNTNIGSQAAYTNTEGSDNNHFGYRSGFLSLNNGVTAAFGNYSLYRNSGIGNSAFGHDAGDSLITGSYNTFLGFRAGHGTSQKQDANFSIAIGNNSYTTKSNQAVLGSTGIFETVLRGKVLIGTEDNNNVDDFQIRGSQSLFNTPALAVAADTFLVKKAGGQINYRTASQVRTDIGAASASSLLDYVTIAGVQTITGKKTLTDTLFGVIGQFNGTVEAAFFAAKGIAGGWDRSHFFRGSAGTNRGGYGAFGGDDALEYYYIGQAFNDNIARFNPSTKLTTLYGRLTTDSSISASKIIGTSATPSISGGSATYIGTGASTSVSGNDMAGVATLVTGTGCGATGASNQNAFTITFSSAYSSAPVVIIQAMQRGGLTSTDAPSMNFFLRRDSVGTTGFTVYLPLGITLTDSTTYEITYHVIGK